MAEIPSITRPMRTMHNPLPPALIDAVGDDPDAILPEDFDPFEIADESLRRKRPLRRSRCHRISRHRRGVRRENSPR